MSQPHKPGYLPWDRTGNRLLVQSSLGKAKPSTYNLPADNYVYGDATVQDPQHVIDLIYGWKHHQNSNNAKIWKEKDLIKTNKECIKNLLYTAKDFHGFRKSATFFKNPKEGNNRITLKLPEEDFAYGESLKYSDPVKLVLANNYGEEDHIMRKTFYQSQTDRKSLEGTRRLSCHVTKSHIIKKEAVQAKLARMEWQKRNAYQYWKINKFLDVPHKVQHRRLQNNKQEIPHSVNEISQDKSKVKSSLVTKSKSSGFPQ